MNKLKKENTNMYEKTKTLTEKINSIQKENL